MSSLEGIDRKVLQRGNCSLGFRLGKISNNFLLHLLNKIEFCNES